MFLMAGCGALAPLAQLIQPPRFEQAGQPADIRFVPPSLGHPAGGASVTIWIRITNPNPFGFTVRTLDTTLLLEGQRAATGDFPLGLPLGAGQESVIPIDLSISFADLPGLANVIRQAASGSASGPASGPASGRAVAYQLDGIVGIDAGRFGQPAFGPMLLVRGELGVPR